MTLDQDALWLVGEVRRRATPADGDGDGGAYQLTSRRDADPFKDRRGDLGRVEIGRGHATTDPVVRAGVNGYGSSGQVTPYHAYQGCRGGDSRHAVGRLLVRCQCRRGDRRRTARGGRPLKRVCQRGCTKWCCCLNQAGPSFQVTGRVDQVVVDTPTTTQRVSSWRRNS